MNQVTDLTPPGSAVLRRHLTQAAHELAAILNLIDDDAERSVLHLHVQKVMEEELQAGSKNRAEAAEHASRIYDLVTRGRAAVEVATVVDIFSRRVQKESA